MVGGFATLIQVIRGGVFRGNPILLIGPGAQINQFASFRAKRAVRVIFGPFDGFAAGGAIYVHRILVRYGVVRLTMRWIYSIVPELL